MNMGNVREGGKEIKMNMKRLKTAITPEGIWGRWRREKSRQRKERIQIVGTSVRTDSCRRSETHVRVRACM